ncbi:serine/threonine protein kinase [Kitasatospora sp. NPDC088391]|uniref:serine/threonine-protein kinase n=1 Tax=Kitasatospora sp. NPDC088391 TaxID=3364074 RepID=UPI003800DF30
MWGRGTVLGGRYALAERLGSGAMGEVWRADDRVLGRQVAVKIVLPALMEDELFAARFRREATVLAAMNHRGVVHIHDYGEDDSEPGTTTAYIVMELLTGRPLDKARDRKGLPPDRALDIAAQVLDALHAAHQQGIVHRDIKPSNLMIDQDGRITVTDFGIARTLADTRITTAHAVIGTALYMAPERAEGRDASAVSDLYSVGVVLYELLAGKPPFTGGTPLEVVLKHVREPVPELPEAVPAPVRAVVARALAKLPADRYPDAAAMAAATRAAMSTPAGLGAIVSLPEPVAPAGPTAPAPPAPESPTVPSGRAPRPDGRRRLVTLVLPLILVTGGGVTAHQLDLLPWQHKSANGPSAQGPGATADPGTTAPGTPTGTGPAATTGAPGTAPPGTEAPAPPNGDPAANNGAGPGTAPGTGTGAGSNPGTGTGNGSNPGTGTGSNPGTGSNTGSANGGSANGGNAGGGGGSAGSGSGTTPTQPKPPGPASGCGGSGWGRLVNVGSGQAVGLKDNAVSAGVAVVTGGYTAYGWIKATDNFGQTTFTACKADSGVSLGANYAGSPSSTELAGPNSYGDLTAWSLADAGSGTFQLKFGYGPQSCLTDHGGGQLTVDSCSPGAKSQLFRFS